MNELEVNRASHLVDPHLAIWGWEVPVYLFLGGIVAGVMILSPLLAARTPIEERSRWARWLPFAAPILISLGMIALFLDLSHKLYVLRFYSAFKPTSPMSWGAWILLLLYPITILNGLAGLTGDEAKKLNAWKPVASLRITGLISWARDLGLKHAKGLSIASVAVGIGLGAYTGLLLGTLGARHVWSSGVMGPLFLVSGLSTGAAMMMLLPVNTHERHLLARWDMGAIAIELGLIGIYILGLVTGGITGRVAVQLFLGGPFTAAFWSLVVFAGLLVPLALELIEHRGRGVLPTAWAPALILIGGFSLRYIMVTAGQI
jgi:protein NrfD